MKYNLINLTTKQETICDKFIKDGFDYYVSYEIPEKEGEKCYSMYTKDLVFFKLPHTIQCKKIIATNNPNTTISKVVDEVERLALHHNDYFNEKPSKTYEREGLYQVKNYIDGSWRRLPNVNLIISTKLSGSFCQTAVTCWADYQ